MSILNELILVFLPNIWCLHTKYCLCAYKYKHTAIYALFYCAKYIFSNNSLYNAAVDKIINLFLGNGHPPELFNHIKNNVGNSITSSSSPVSDDKVFRKYKVLEITIHQR